MEGQAARPTIFREQTTRLLLEMHVGEEEGRDIISPCEICDADRFSHFGRWHSEKRPKSLSFFERAKRS